MPLRPAHRSDERGARANRAECGLPAAELSGAELPLYLPYISHISGLPYLPAAVVPSGAALRCSSRLLPALREHFCPPIVCDLPVHPDPWVYPAMCFEDSPVAVRGGRPAGRTILFFSCVAGKLQRQLFLDSAEIQLRTSSKTESVYGISIVARPLFFWQR